MALSSILLAAAVWFGRCRQTLICAAVLLLAGGYGAVERMQTPADASLPIAEMLVPEQQVVGTVTADPQRSEAGDAVTFRLKLVAVHLPDGWRASDATVRVRMKLPAPAVVYGEQWRVSGR
ncbi:MAG TPA: DUF4131 domain-containing protein, partial [Tichowtungia sp.]|nr:DUF4131 domain-containing protein [Tichowtungia sp.]